jgi:hypothetical protein
MLSRLMKGLMAALEIERKYLAAHKDQLLRQYGDKFLIIAGEQVAGAYDTIEQALRAVAEKHGLRNVLVRRPSEAQLEFSAPALTLGILRANPS